MTITMKTFAAAVLATAAFAGFAAMTADVAEAKRGGGTRSYVWSETTPHMPRRGYEGFAGIGLGYYCSYRREPWRKCFTNRYGEESCRTVGWRKVQHCY